MLNENKNRWRAFLFTGGISVFIYILTAIIIPGIMTLLIKQDIVGDNAIHGAALLYFVAKNKFYWIALQTLVLETSIFPILTFIALYLVLRDHKPNSTLAGTVIGVSSQILFMAYFPMLMGLVFPGDNYVLAKAADRQLLAAAAEGLGAMVNAFNPVYEALLAIGIFLVSLAIPGSQIRKWLAPCGFITGVVTITAIALFPLIGYWYMWWWVLYIIWFSGVGIELIRISRLKEKVN